MNWRNRLSDFRVLSQLRRYSLSEVVQAELAAAPLSSVAYDEQKRQILSLDERGDEVDPHARQFIARMKAQWENGPRPSRPMFVPLLTASPGFFAASNINLAKWILDDPNAFDRASVLQSFAAAFDLQSVFTTEDKKLGQDLKRYFTKRTNGLSVDQLGALMEVLKRRADGMMSTLSDGAEVPFVPKIEGMVLEAYAEAFFSMDLFPHAEKCAVLIKKIWQIKSLRNNIPSVRLNPLPYLRMRRLQSRLFSIISAAQDMVRQSRSAAANEMEEVYRANGYAPGNLLNALIPLYEAISRGVIYALIELARAPSLQADLRREIDANKGRELEYCGATDTLLHRVWQETLRLWPPTPNQTRRTKTDSNPFFPKGSKVVVVWSLFHRDPQVWGADVAAFVPDRWLRLTPDQQLSYNPFGSGAQHCVAMDYASFGGRILLRSIIESRLIQLPAAPPKALSSDRAYSRGPDPSASSLRFRQLEKAPG